jgi:hypothetical protein
MPVTTGGIAFLTYALTLLILLVVRGMKWTVRSVRSLSR